MACTGLGGAKWDSSELADQLNLDTALARALLPSM